MDKVQKFGVQATKVFALGFISSAGAFTGMVFVAKTVLRSESSKKMFSELADILRTEV